MLLTRTEFVCEYVCVGRRRSVIIIITSLTIHPTLSDFSQASVVWPSDWMLHMCDVHIYLNVCMYTDTQPRVYFCQPYYLCSTTSSWILQLEASSLRHTATQIQTHMTTSNHLSLTDCVMLNLVFAHYVTVETTYYTSFSRQYSTHTPISKLNLIHTTVIIYSSFYADTL